MKYLILYKQFFLMDIKRLWMYKLDFIIGNLGFFLDTLLNLFAIMIVFSQTISIGEFSVYQMIFFFAFLMFVSALWEFFFVRVLEIPYMIQTGELDLFLLRPINVLYQFVIFKLDEEAVFEFLAALGLIIYIIFQLDIQYPILFGIKLILFIISSMMIKHTIYLAISSISFWHYSSEGATRIVWQFYQLSQYPSSIYPNAIKLLVIIIPFALAGYYPVLNLLTEQAFFTINTLALLIMPPFLLWLVYRFIFLKGLSHYSSTGS